MSDEMEPADKPEAKPTQPNIRDPNFFFHATEVTAGFSLACILTLSFMGPLHWQGKTALCIFALAFPMLVNARFLLVSDDLAPPRTYLTLLTLGTLVAFVGMCFLLAEVYIPAFVVFLAASFVMVLLIQPPERTPVPLWLKIVWGVCLAIVLITLVVRLVVFHRP